MITVEISGFDPEDFRRDLAEMMASHIREHVGEITCPEHGEVPSVVISAVQEDELGFEVRACCDLVREPVDEALRTAFDGADSDEQDE